MELTHRLQAVQKLPGTINYHLTNGDLSITDLHQFIYKRFLETRDYRYQQALSIWQSFNALNPTSENDQVAKNYYVQLAANICQSIQNYSDLNQYISQASPLLQNYVDYSWQIYNNSANKEALIEQRTQIIRCYLILLANYADLAESAVATVETSGSVKKSAGRKSKLPDGEIDTSAICLAMQRFQGTQQKKESLEGLYIALDMYFGSFGMYTRQHAATLPFDHKGRKVGTSFRMMIRALKETGNTGYNPDCNLICANYWGWKLPNISHLEDKIKENFIKTQKVFLRIKPGIRSSNLNIDVLLKKHLQAVGFPCDDEDFHDVTSPAILRTYENLLETMFKEAGLPYVPE